MNNVKFDLKYKTLKRNNIIDVIEFIGQDKITIVDFENIIIKFKNKEEIIAVHENQNICKMIDKNDNIDIVVK